MLSVTWEAAFKNSVDEEKHKCVIDLFQKARDEQTSAWHYGEYTRSLFSLEMKGEGVDVIFDEAVELCPNDLSIRIRHAEIAMSTRKWSAAIWRWNYIRGNFSRFPEGVYWRLVRAYIFNYDFSGAKEVVRSIENIVGNSQKVKDLISEIESAEAKKYTLVTKKISDGFECHIENLVLQDKLGKISLFQNYAFKGWVKRPKDTSYKLIFKNSEGAVDCVELNSTRDDVVRHFRERGEDVQAVCGFDYCFDIRRGGCFGFLIEGVEFWVFDFKLSEVLNVLEGSDG